MKRFLTAHLPVALLVFIGLAFVFWLDDQKYEAHAQTAGTVTVATTTTVAATAGAVNCSFVSGSNIQITCQGATAAPAMTETLPVPVPQPAVIGAFNIGTDRVGFTFEPPGSTAGSGCPATTTGTCWQIVANGTSKNGTF